ncbi:MAG TPA: dicarboxylate/amino acid:cation symporter [Gammaproteobacteria bacterium]|jgi:Na+/H+-dicarboxylate symporter|nr:dicarboxylate/amino acid:cation symporter [Gammaproteobacteria bacterium]
MQKNMFWWIMASIVLAIIGGIYFPHTMISMSWLGKVFINLLKLIALPLIFSALVSAITSMGSFKKLGSIGIYTIGYVILSVAFAVCIGLFLLNLVKPGVGIPAELILANSSPEHLKPVIFSDFLLTLFPPNIIDAAAKFEIMSVVIFSIAFSIACISVGETAQPVILFFAALRNIFVKMIIWLMYLTPIGLFSLLGTAIAEANMQDKLMQSVNGMSLFILVFLFGLALQILWQFGLVKFFMRKRAKEFARAASPAMLTAFVTSSSIATLPVALLAAKKQNTSDEVARFVLPFATTINLAGTAMYEAVSTVFFCQILGMDLSIMAQIGIFVASIMAGMGATGIPEGGLVTMVMVLRSVNVPTSAIALLLPFDRILDRFRTMTNVWGDLVCAAMVDHISKKPKETENADLPYKVPFSQADAAKLLSQYPKDL